jgi:CHAD domain-containing protein
MPQLEFLRGFIEEHGKKLDPISLDDAGSLLTQKLIGHRAHQVYGVGARPWPEDTVELVHDLRVGCRRLREALAIASPCLDPERTERANVRAQALGRVLGERRIADVMIEEVRERFAQEASAVPGLEDVLQARRMKATKAVWRAFPEDRLLRHGAKVIELGQRANANVTLRDIAAPHLKRRVSRVEALIPFLEDPHNGEAHHQLRIKLKRLRYSAEIFGDVFKSELDEKTVLPPLKQMQDALGILNDAQELRRLIRGMGRRKGLKGDAGLRALIERVDRTVAERYTAAKELVTTRGIAAVHALKESARALSRAPAA